MQLAAEAIMQGEDLLDPETEEEEESLKIQTALHQSNLQWFG